MVHFSVWLAATFKSELFQQVPTAMLAGTAKHQNPDSYSLSPPYISINSTSPAPVTVFFLTLWTSRESFPFRIKRLVALANSQEVESRGKMLFQFSFKAIMKCRVKTLRNSWPLNLAHYYFSLCADFKISARVGAMLQTLLLAFIQPPFSSWQTSAMTPALKPKCEAECFYRTYTKNYWRGKWFPWWFVPIRNHDKVFF